MTLRILDHLAAVWGVSAAAAVDRLALDEINRLYPDN
jgi:plasmid stabilization system protein ParE